MAPNRQLLLIGFTLLGGALGFYVEEKAESHYKEERFRHFERAVLAKRRERDGPGSDAE